jgi:hypothetical protein
MRKYMPEFAAVPMVVVGLGVVFLVLWALDAGLGVWIAVGAIGLAALVIITVIAMRRPRGVVASGGAASFDGAAPPVRDGRHRVLVVTDGQCAATDLAEIAPLRDRSGSIAFVVAPALSSRAARWTGDEHAYRDAEESLASTVAALTSLGLEASGRVGSHDPLQAADDGLREFPADEVAFVLHGDGKGSWLEEGVPELARARYPVPVHEVTVTGNLVV